MISAGDDPVLGIRLLPYLASYAFLGVFPSSIGRILGQELGCQGDVGPQF
jgi:hypothetical protein